MAHAPRPQPPSGPARNPGEAVVWLHPDAPAKPLHGTPCNGCGLCCLAQPCPLGMLLSRRRTGACVALQWSDAQQRYLCGLVADPGRATGWTHPWAQRAVSAWARRSIAAGVGCDAHLAALSSGDGAPGDS